MAVDQLVGSGSAQPAEWRRGEDEHEQCGERSGAAHDEVAERHDPGFRDRRARQHDGDDAAAEISAQHQNQAEFHRNQATRSQRNDQQYRRDAGMEQPGHDGGKQEGRDRVA
jgi:hypothetical protein